jgi:hypothetical protein
MASHCQYQRGGCSHALPIQSKLCPSHGFRENSRSTEVFTLCFSIFVLYTLVRALFFHLSVRENHTCLATSVISLDLSDLIYCCRLSIYVASVVVPADTTRILAETVTVCQYLSIFLILVLSI